MEQTLPAVGEPVAALIRHRSLQTEARIAHDGCDHYSDWSDWEPATVQHALAVTDPARNTHPLLWEARLLVDCQPQPAAQQEPVVTVWQARATHDSKSAWRQVAPTKTESTVEARVEYLKTVRRAGGEPAYEFRALYTSPPQVQRAGLTDEQIDRHSIAAVDCPPSSTVILVSSLRRLLGITATKGER